MGCIPNPITTVPAVGILPGVTAPLIQSSDEGWLKTAPTYTNPSEKNTPRNVSWNLVNPTNIAADGGGHVNNPVYHGKTYRPDRSTRCLAMTTTTTSYTAPIATTSTSQLWSACANVPELPRKYSPTMYDKQGYTGNNYLAHNDKYNWHANNNASNRDRSNGHRTHKNSSITTWKENDIYNNLYRVDNNERKEPHQQLNKSNASDQRHKTSTTQPDIVVIMDSNRKHINFDNLFMDEKVEVMACGNVKSAMRAVMKPGFVAPKTVYIHLGTNDLNHGSPQEFLSSLLQLSKHLAEEGSEVYVSEILPRLDANLPLTDQVNSMLRNTIPEEYLIPHPQILHTHLFDEVHLRRNTLTGELYSGVQLLARDFYRSRFNKDPMDSRISQSLGGDQRRPRSRSNSKNRNSGQ